MTKGRDKKALIQSVLSRSSERWGRDETERFRSELEDVVFAIWKLDEFHFDRSEDGLLAHDGWWERVIRFQERPPDPR